MANEIEIPIIGVKLPRNVFWGGLIIALVVLSGFPVMNVLDDFIKPGKDKETQAGTLVVTANIKGFVYEYLNQATALSSGTVNIIRKQNANTGMVDACTIGSDGSFTSNDLYTSWDPDSQIGDQVYLYFDVDTTYHNWCTELIDVPKATSDDAGQTLPLGTYYVIKSQTAPTESVVDDMAHAVFTDASAKEYDVDSATYTSATDTFHWSMVVSHTTADQGVLNWDWTDYMTTSPLLKTRGSYLMMKFFSTTATNTYASDCIVSGPSDMVKFEYTMNGYYYIIPLTSEREWVWRDTDDASQIVNDRTGAVTFPQFEIDCSAYGSGAGANQGITVDFYIFSGLSLDYFYKYNGGTHAASTGLVSYHTSGTYALYIGDSDS